MKSKWDSTMRASCSRPLPELYTGLVDDLNHVYSSGFEILDAPVMVKFGSWIGGDRDGHPHVTWQCTEYALSSARRTILEFYARRIRDLETEIEFIHHTSCCVGAIAEQAAGIHRPAGGRDYRPSLTSHIEGSSHACCTGSRLDYRFPKI